MADRRSPTALAALMRDANAHLAAAHGASMPDGFGLESEQCLWRLVATAGAIEQLLLGAERERQGRLDAVEVPGRAFAASLARAVEISTRVSQAIADAMSAHRDPPDASLPCSGTPPVEPLPPDALSAMKANADESFRIAVSAIEAMQSEPPKQPRTSRKSAPEAARRPSRCTELSTRCPGKRPGTAPRRPSSRRGVRQ